MKAKVIIENGETTIVLTPENNFEKSVMESARKDSTGYDFKTSVTAEYSYQEYKNHCINIQMQNKNEIVK